MLVTPALAKKLLIPLLAVGVAAWAVKIDLTAFGRFHAPDLALALSSDDARALSTKADTLLRRSQTPATLAQIEKLSRRALRREVTSPVALRNLAMVAASRNELGEASRLMQFAEQLSRRDVPTQLWLIEQSVKANDVPGALKHFDHALRSSPDIAKILMPILIKATDDPTLVGPIGQILSRPSLWRYDFLTAVVNEGPSTQGLAALEKIVDRSSLPLSEDTTYALEQRYMRDQAYALAWDLYRRRISKVPGERPDQIRNGNFNRDPGYSPFEWSSATQANIRSYVDTVPRQGRAMIWQIEEGAAGEVSRQLVLLPRGAYQLRVNGAHLTDGEAMARPIWSVVCLDSKSTGLGSLEAVGRGLRRLNFTVDDNCPAIWLVLSLASNDAPGISEGWVDQISIIPNRAIN